MMGSVVYCIFYVTIDGLLCYSLFVWEMKCVSIAIDHGFSLSPSLPPSGWNNISGLVGCGIPTPIIVLQQVRPLSVFLNYDYAQCHKNQYIRF